VITILHDSKFGTVSCRNELNILRYLDNEFKYKAVVYHNKNCVKCMLTMKHLKIPFTPVLMGDKEHKTMRSMGIMSAPVVIILHADDIVDWWNDFKKDKIDYWNKKYKEAKNEK